MSQKPQNLDQSKDLADKHKDKKISSSTPQELQEPAATEDLDFENPFGMAPQNIVDEDAIAEKLIAKLQESGLLQSHENLNPPDEKAEIQEDSTREPKFKARTCFAIGAIFLIIFVGRGFVQAVTEVSAVSETAEVSQEPVQPPPPESDTRKAANLMADQNAQAVRARADYLYQKFNQEAKDPKFSLLLYIEARRFEYLDFAQANPQVGGEAEQNDEFTKLTRELEASYLALMWMDEGYPQGSKTVDLTRFRQQYQVETEGE